MHKYLLFLLIVLSCSSCINSDESETSVSDNYDWLLGEWVRTNEGPDRNTYENWTKQSDTLYLGLGYTLQNTDTVFKEEIHLMYSGKQWQYVVHGVNRRPTSFRVTKKSNNSFISINENNPFPKHIKYSLENNILTAEISADGRKIRFLFEQHSTDSKQ